MKLLVGLGNPGQKYDRNRHNIGFLAVDEIAGAHGFAPWRSRFKGLTAEGLIDGQKCLLLKPQTYMNLSGEAVREAVQFYKIDNADITVLHDEIDLPPAKLKIKTDGGNAGHNGLKSISQHIGNDYVRLRMGVGRPMNKQQVATYVLKDFSKEDETWLDDTLRSIGRHAGLLVGGRNSDFLKEISEDLAPLQPSKPKKATKPAENKDNLKTSETTKPEQKKAAPERDEKQDQKAQNALGAALAKWLHKGD